MATPRPYLSFSQMALFEMSPQKYADQYFYGQRQRISRNMKYGSIMAEGLEKEEMTGDPFLDLMMAQIPKFERMDRPVEDPRGQEVHFERDKCNVRIPVLENFGDNIPLLAVPDTSKSDYTGFKEYKTSVRRWTQKMADESGQITFYQTAIWLLTRSIVQDIELVNIPVRYQPDGSLCPTGDILRLPTSRNMADILKMTKRIRKAWAGIQELYQKELL